MDKISYALGMSIAHNLLRSGVKDLNTEDFAAAIKATLSGEKPAISHEEAGDILDKFFGELEEAQKKEQEAAAKIFKKQGEDFLEANKKEDGVVVLPSGLQYKIIKKGNGAKPKATDQVICNYEGTLVDGTKFDSSWDRNQPAQFGLNQVIPGWTEGLQLMNEGSEYMFYIPYKLGYGEAGAHGAIPPYAALIFRVELIEVVG